LKSTVNFCIPPPSVTSASTLSFQGRGLKFCIQAPDINAQACKLACLDGLA